MINIQKLLLLNRSTRDKLALSTGVAAIGLLTTSIQAQYLNVAPSSSDTPQRLIGDGDVFPEATVSSLSGVPTISPTGDVIARVRTNFLDFTTFQTVTTDRFYGGDPAAPGVVLIENSGTTPTTALGSGRFNAAGQLGYSAKLSTGAQFEPDGIFLDDTLLVQEQAAVPTSAGVESGAIFDNATGLIFTDILADGDVVFYGQYTTSQTLTGSAPGSSLDGTSGNVIDQAIFRYDNATGQFSTILKSGDTISNPVGSDFALGPAEIEPGGTGGLGIQPLSSIQFSDNGSNYLAQVDVDPNINIQINLNPDPSVAEPNGITNSLLLNNAFLTLSDGTLVQEGQEVSSVMGGDAMPVKIRDIGSYDVNDSGDYAVVIEVGNPDFQNDADDSDFSELLVVNGQEAFRNTSSNDRISNVTINNQGDIAYIFQESIYLNGDVILEPGDVTSNGTLFDLTGGIALSDRDANESATLALLGRTNASGGTNRAFFTMDVEWSAILAGDYNGDGVVDAADYTVWADNLGSMIDLDADGSGNGTIDEADYTIWASNFGNTLPGSVSTTVIPEPTSVMLAGLGFLGLLSRRRPDSV